MKLFIIQHRPFDFIFSLYFIPKLLVQLDTLSYTILPFNYRIIWYIVVSIKIYIIVAGNEGEKIVYHDFTNLLKLI